MKRFETLDLLRGGASAAVVAFHLGTVKLSPGLVSHGYLAVDLFFLLSGFVISHAYERPIISGLSWKKFILMRILRLYPLAFMGTIIGFLIVLAKLLLYQEKSDSLPQVLFAGLSNLLMLPTFISGPGAHYELFPNNGPLWSLFLELVINLAWAAGGFRLRTPYVILIVILSAIIMLIYLNVYETLNLGFDTSTALGGLARVCFGFPLGVLLHRFKDFIPTIREKYYSLLMLLILFIVFTGPANGFGMGRIAWDSFSVFFIFPAVIFFGAAIQPFKYISRIFGEVSYPIYVLHFPILLLTSGAYQELFPKMSSSIVCIGVTLTILLIGFASARFLDLPARNLVGRIMSNRQKDILI